MPGLIGYMLAIVVTLGGYFAGLHWLVSPPDPWQLNAKNAAGSPQPAAARKRKPAAVKPAEAAASFETSLEPDKVASVETTASVETSEAGTARPIEQNIALVTRSAEATPQIDAARPAIQPAHVARREVSPIRTRSANRKRVEKNTGRKLQLMVLRTYERSDGKRFTRLLPLSSVRSAMAFQPAYQW